MMQATDTHEPGEQQARLEAAKLVRELTARGFNLSVDGDRLHATPGSQLTEADRNAIRRLKPFILATLLENAKNAENAETPMSAKAPPTLLENAKNAENAETPMSAIASLEGDFPPSPPHAIADETDARELQQECYAIHAESTSTTKAPVLTASTGKREDTILSTCSLDWCLEWHLEVGLLYLRMRTCDDEVVLAKLKTLADASPTSLTDWLALGLRIRDMETELRGVGKLPAYYWPMDGRTFTPR